MRASYCHLTNASWDVRSTRVVEWLALVVQQKRVFHIHFGAIYITIARTLKSRTKDMPLGKFGSSVKEAAIIADGNVMLLRTMLVLFPNYDCFGVLISLVQRNWWLVAR